MYHRCDYDETNNSEILIVACTSRVVGLIWYTAEVKQYRWSSNILILPGAMHIYHVHTMCIPCAYHMHTIHGQCIFLWHITAKSHQCKSDDKLFGSQLKQLL